MSAKTHNADWLDQTSTQIDLRKKLSERRADAIKTRADWLNPDEQSLVLAVFRDGYSASEIARLKNDDPRKVRRKIKRALERLQDPHFVFVVRRSTDWSPTRKNVARAIFKSGLSIREAASQLGISIHHIRRHRDSIIEMMHAENVSPESTSFQIDRNWR